VLGVRVKNEFKGKIGRTFDDSTPWWPPLTTPPEGSPNVLVVLLDDVGYAQFGCYGSDIATPTFDKLAGNGLRYSNYHTTALCSPTRAALLTGRNPHSVGMGRVADIVSGFPGYNSIMPASAGMISEILVRNGYATYLLGKWHLSPQGENQMGSTRERWPLGRGFERFYGFLGGETDQYHPDLVYDNHQVDPPRTPEQGYHITEDLADKAELFINDLRAAHPEKPFFMWFAPGACHAPHQAPKNFIDAYRGKFDKGWDVWREEVFARQKKSGLLPSDTILSERPHWVPEWASLSGDEKKLYSRMMEVYAGFLTHTDAQVGRVVKHIESMGELDNTIVLVMSDNGASSEGGPKGSFNEMFYFNFIPESLEENIKRIDLLGTPEAHNHYPWGWAWAGNTPFKRWKRETHEGGVTDPLIVHWPKKLGAKGEVRTQYLHSVDVMPTLLELIGIEPPTHIAGVEQQPIEGVSFAHTLGDAKAQSKHVTQCYEMLGSRALYHDGWKAVVFHQLPGLPGVPSYDGSDPNISFDVEQWELYHVEKDIAETNDLAREHPEKLQEMIALWWELAEKQQILPLNNQPGRFGDKRYRQERYEYRPGIGAIPPLVAPMLRNRSFEIFAEVTVPATGVEGAIIAQGSGAGGYAVFVKDKRLHYVHNFLDLYYFSVSAEVDLPVGVHTLRVEFKSTGRFKGEVNLYYDDLPVGSGAIPATVPVFFGVFGLTVGYLRGSSVIRGVEAPFSFTASALQRVIVVPAGRSWRDPQGDERVASATQ